MMVAFYPHFVSCGEKATLSDVVGELDEFNYLIRASFASPIIRSLAQTINFERNLLCSLSSRGENMQMSCRTRKCVENFYLFLPSNVAESFSDAREKVSKARHTLTSKHSRRE